MSENNITTSNEIVETETTNNVVEFPNNESKVALGTYDPTTGNFSITDPDPDLERISQENFANFSRLLNEERVEDFEKDLKNFLKNDISSNIKTDDEASAVAYLMANRMANNNIDYYTSMPKFMQTTVSQLMASANTSGVPANKIMHRNQVAKLLIDEYIDEYKRSNSKTVDLDLMFSKIEKDAEVISTESSVELAETLISLDAERKDSIEKSIIAARSVNNEKAAKALEEIRNNIDKAYDLTEFKEFCKHCKIKNIEIKKPNRVYDSFIHKYENHDAVINDIRQCPIIIIRHLTEFTTEQAMTVCLAYCKYCCNMSPNNIAEHTFMYYFTRNIITIDRINPRGKAYDAIDPKEKEFYDTFVSNLRECINNLLERNATLK